MAWWAKKVESAIRTRDDILHRPPVRLVIGDDPGDSILGWNRARRSHRLGEIAQDYLAQVREMQPHGPYLLAGWSFGGVVAQEMAVALENLGEDVPVLILFDASPTERGNGQPADELPDELISLIEQSIRGVAAVYRPTCPTMTWENFRR